MTDGVNVPSTPRENKAVFLGQMYQQFLGAFFFSSTCLHASVLASIEEYSMHSQRNRVTMGNPRSSSFLFPGHFSLDGSHGRAPPAGQRLWTRIARTSNATSKAFCQYCFQGQFWLALLRSPGSSELLDKSEESKPQAFQCAQTRCEHRCGVQD